MSGFTDALEELEAALDIASAGESQIRWLRAVDGSGKTQLCRELERRATREGARVIVHSGRPEDRSDPLCTVSGILRAVLGVAPTGSSEKCRDAIAAADLSPTSRSNIAALLAGDRAPQSPSPRAAGEALDELLEATGRLQPTVLILDDCQHIDRASARQLETPPPGARCLIVVTATPGETLWCENAPASEQVQLTDAPDLAATSRPSGTTIATPLGAPGTRSPTALSHAEPPADEPDGRPASAARTAFRLARAGEFDRAWPWLLRAADQIGSWDATAVAELFRDATTVADQTSEASGAARFGALAATSRLARPLLPTDHATDDLNAFRSAEIRCRREQLHEDLIQLHCAYGRRRFAAGHIRDAVDLFEEAIVAADTRGDGTLGRIARVAALPALAEARPADEVLRVAERTIELCGDAASGAPIAEASARLHQINAQLRGGQLRETGRALAMLHPIAAAHRALHPSLLQTWLTLTALHGDGPGAEIALEALRPDPDDLVPGENSLFEGRRLLGDGDPERALPAFRAATAEGDRTRIALEARAGAAAAALALGHADEAREEAHWAAARAAARGCLRTEAEARVLEVEASGPPDADPSREAATRAAWLIGHLGYAALLPRLHEAEARAASRGGDTSDFERRIRLAHQGYIRLGAWGHARRLAEERAPENGPAFSP